MRERDSSTISNTIDQIKEPFISKNIHQNEEKQKSFHNSYKLQSPTISKNNNINQNIHKISTTSSINSKKNIQEEPYPIYMNFPELNENDENNSINTSKYKWYTFFPKMLMIELSRMANIYFLIIAILETINEISYSNGSPLILIPLTFVVCLNGIKDLYEDFKRKESDKKENNTIALIYDKNKKFFIEKKWMDIKQGDIVKILKDQQIPADLLLLSSSEESGLCYIETKNIDGETNLKNKQCHQKLKEIIKNEKDLLNLKYVCITKPPDEFIYKFDATLYKINDLGKIIDIKNYILIDNNSFLLRGCILRQTDYIIGLTIYIGEHTKTMLNSPKVKQKISSVEKVMNYQIVAIFLI